MIHRISKIYWPLSVVPKNAYVTPGKLTSKSQKLMLELGLIKSIGSGLFQITPLANRVLNKFINHIDYHMEKIDCQKMTLSVLTSSSLWKKSGRLNNDTNEIFTIKDRQDKLYLLSPTHEEAITSLIANSYPISYKQLPIKLYQIGPKFRDELKPRFGLLRSKEFIMKDLYSFDKDIESAEETYNSVGKQYEKIFHSLEVPWIKVQGDPGTMGGTFSHEYHMLSNIGEDSIIQCKDCNFVANIEICPDCEKCPSCHGNNLNMSKGIEIGHTFLLHDKYSKTLGAKFLSNNGKPEHMLMGSYGIGVTRLIAACLEVLSTEENLKWPVLIAPFDVCIIPPKDGSQEEKVCNNLLNDFLSHVSNICETDSIVIDDRTNLTIGKRLMDSKKMGYPLIIVIGSKILNDPPQFELHDNNKNTVNNLGAENILELIRKFIKYKENLKLL